MFGSASVDFSAVLFFPCWIYPLILQLQIIKSSTKCCFNCKPAGHDMLKCCVLLSENQSYYNPLIITSHYYSINVDSFSYCGCLIVGFFVFIIQQLANCSLWVIIDPDKTSINYKVLDYIFKKLPFYITGKKANSYGHWKLCFSSVQLTSQIISQTKIHLHNQFQMLKS